jgi:anti-sigma factor RsiW
MSHLGDLTSALVDGELTGAELDRANAHLAACAACRAEAAVVRRLKRELSALADVAGAEALTRRLLAMPGPSDLRPRGTPGLRDPLRSRPLPRAQSGRARRHRGRYAVLGVSLVVAGVGAAAFGMGGGGSTPTERQITPQLEMFDLQHAVTSGDVPFAGAQKAGAQKAGAQKAGAQKAGAQKAPGQAATKP